MPINFANIRHVIAGIALIAGAACSQPAPLGAGSWEVDDSDSTLSFVTIKNGNVGEAHVFKKLGGSVSPDGTASLTIDLASVDTGIEIRDQRMRDVLFEIGAYPRAEVSTKVDPASLTNLAVGQSVTQDLAATLDLHGIKSEVEANVRILRTGADSVLVTTTRPMILDAEPLGLVDGVEKLRELAGLTAISSAVPVSFAIIFHR